MSRRYFRAESRFLERWLPAVQLPNASLQESRILSLARRLLPSVRPEVDEAHAERPPTPPSNPCYLSCDYPVATTHLLCGADWAQQFSSAPEVKDSCWDGSIITSTQLVAQTLTENACPLTTERRPRPFAPNQGTLSASDQPPATITKGFSCTDDTDCADRNQWCDPKAGDSPATNGWGRCVNGRDAGPFDITPVPANGLSLKSVLLQSDAGCWFGFECQSGQCSVRHCR